MCQFTEAELSMEMLHKTTTTKLIFEIIVYSQKVTKNGT